MKKQQIIQFLQDRQLIHQTTEKNLTNTLSQFEKIKVYCGFDPTAESLHVGHLIPLLCLKYFQQAGYEPFIVIGGATALIGDPSFRGNSRNNINVEEVKTWYNNISKQIKKFLKFDGLPKQIKVLNNHTWLSNLSVINFLQNVGKNFHIKKMLSQESNKKRLNSTEHSFSYTEFTYSILQGYDFYHLHKNYGVILQIGGSDQWNNIISGINLVQNLSKDKVFGITMPLVTKSDGTKFGKTAQDTIWLDAKKTSVYKFYQFWLNVQDQDVYKFLKLFTTLSLEEIDSIKRIDSSSVGKPKAQKILAQCVTRLVHGDELLNSAERITQSFFTKDFANLTIKDLDTISKEQIPKLFFYAVQIDLTEVLVRSKFAKSNREARELMNSGAISINGKRLKTKKETIDKKDMLFYKYTFLQKGKKNFCLLVKN